MITRVRAIWSGLLYRTEEAVAGWVVTTAEGVIERYEGNAPTTKRQAIGDRLWIVFWRTLEQALLAVHPLLEGCARKLL